MLHSALETMYDNLLFKLCFQLQIAPLHLGAGRKLVRVHRRPPREQRAGERGGGCRATQRPRQGLTLVHIFSQPEPILSLKPAKRPTPGTKSAHVELKSGLV
jgi:hypothetical protein